MSQSQMAIVSSLCGRVLTAKYHLNGEMTFLEMFVNISCDM